MSGSSGKDDLSSGRSDLRGKKSDLRGKKVAFLTYNDGVEQVELTGELDIAGYLAVAEANGYLGWAGLEYNPSTSTLASLLGLDIARVGDRI